MALLLRHWAWFEKIIWISAALGCGRDPAWGAKKVGEVPCRDGHIFFALAGCVCLGKERNESPGTGPASRWGGKIYE